MRVWILLAVVTLILLYGGFRAAISNSPSSDFAGEGIASVPSSPLSLNRCAGAYAEVDYPYGTQPGGHPPGWDLSLLQYPFVVVPVDLMFWHCREVRWGPFEGPLSIILEFHSNLTPPSRCDELSPPSISVILNSLWVDNAQVADWLAHRYSLRTHYSDIKFNESITGPFTDREFSWRLSNGPTNTISFHLDLSSPWVSEPNNPFRMFWHNQTGLFYLDFSFELQTHPMSSQYPTSVPGGWIATGKAYPPLLVATYSNEFSGTSSLFANSNAVGTIHQFQDFECKRKIE